MLVAGSKKTLHSLNHQESKSKAKYLTSNVAHFFSRWLCPRILFFQTQTSSIRKSFRTRFSRVERIRWTIQRFHRFGRTCTLYIS